MAEDTRGGVAQAIGFTSLLNTVIGNKAFQIVLFTCLLINPQALAETPSFTGPHNDITDVPGVTVGHVTIKQDHPHTLRTGVTAIIPHAGNLATEGLLAYGEMLNGNGELTGLGPLQDTGVLNSPILLTNTTGVGAVHQGVFDYFDKHYPDQWMGQLPVIGECYDGFFNTITDRTAITPATAVQALESATSGPVAQGRVGAGTGMKSFYLHAGIGSASRQIKIKTKTYTLGVLVNMNHSHFEEMNPAFRKRLEEKLGPLEKVKEKDALDSVTPRPITPRQGSIIIVLATDLPLIPSQLKALSKRALLGIGATGSTLALTSGDGVVAFSTATRLNLKDNADNQITLPMIHPDSRVLSEIYRATVIAVREAQVNALLAAQKQ